MDLIKVPKVEHVWLELTNSSANAQLVTLHMLPHHILLRWVSEPARELWIPYAGIQTAKKKKNPRVIPVDPSQRLHYPLFISCRNFMRIKLYIPTDTECLDVSMSLKSLTQVASLERLYAFEYRPKYPFSTDGWKLYDSRQEFGRLGVGHGEEASWRFSEVNKEYSLSPTYPKVICVPSNMSDAVLYHAAKFRSRGRLPALTYIHPSNKASITRSSQPLVGLQAKRSIQDERLLLSIFESSTDNLIIDARPLGNAMANRAMGAGTESLENYKNCRRLFMGIDNIHVMRDSLTKLVDACHDGDDGVDKWHSALDSSNWLKHIRTILESGNLITKTIESGGNVLIHCSDGWDRTAQLSSLASICLDPYYRTINGLENLIEKEWLSFGHKFSDRLGHIQKHSATHPHSSSSKDEKETAPVFQQFLEASHRIMRQFPHEFEYNERLLIDLQDYAYNCHFGTFLLNNERERIENRLPERTQSVWSYINENLDDYRSPLFRPETHKQRKTLYVSSAPKEVPYWSALYSRFDDEVFGESGFYTEPGPSSSLYAVRNPYLRRSARSIEEAFTIFQRRQDQLDHSIALLHHHLQTAQKKVELLKQKTESNGPDVEDIRSKHPLQTVEASTLLPPKQSACSVCHGIFFLSDPQWSCFWCAKVVCKSCSRYQLRLTDLIPSDQQQQDKDNNSRSWRACDMCYARVMRRRETQPPS